MSIYTCPDCGRQSAYTMFHRGEPSAACDRATSADPASGAGHWHLLCWAPPHGCGRDQVVAETAGNAATLHSLRNRV